MMIKDLNNIDSIFSNLDKWRNFPNYQLERRADIFFALYLEEIIENKVHHKVTGIIPEFPIRIGSIYEDIKINKSFKIDYVAFCKFDNLLYLVELKTDTGSVRPEQIKYLKRTEGTHIDKIIDGLKHIKKATNKKYQGKYNALFSELKNIHLINFDGINISLKNNNIVLKILYIVPEYTEQMKKDGIEEYEVITFDSVIKSIKRHHDSFTNRFIQSLELWKNPQKSLIV